MAASTSPADVLVVYQTALFAHGVLEFIGATPEIRIVGMESNFTKALEIAQNFNPTVVIVEEGAEPASCPLRILPDAGSCPLFAFLRQASVERVMSLRIDDTTGMLYQTQRVVVPDASSLISAVLGVVPENTHVTSEERGGDAIA